MKHSLNQQLQCIDFCLRLLNKTINPSKSEREYIIDILATIRARIESALDRELAK